MLQKTYESSLNSIAGCAQNVGVDIVAAIGEADPANTIIAVAEHHRKLVQSFFQVNLFRSLNTQIACDYAFDLVPEDIFATENPGEKIWKSAFSTAVRHVHGNCLFAMGDCLAPSYVLSQITPSFLCNDLDMDDDEAETAIAMAKRDRIVADSLVAHQNIQAKPIIQVCGNHHLVDSERPEAASLLDLLDNKQIIVVNLYAEKNWEVLHRHQQRKIAHVNRDKPIVIAELSVALPPAGATPETGVYNVWDKIALANDTPELLLSKKHRRFAQPA